MGLLSFKCEECGTKINKFNSLDSIFKLKQGRIIECEQCESQYQIPKSISIMGKIYGEFWLSILIYFLIIYLIDLLNLKLGIIVFVYALIISVGIELMVAVILPIKKIKVGEE